MMSSILWSVVAVLTTYPMVSPTSCPEVCRCFGGEVDCIYGNLAFVPRDLQTYGGIVDFSFNMLTHINRTSLENLTQVQTIKLYRNQLLSIEPMAFSHLNTLKELDLGNNNLTSLPSDVFSGLTGLETLYMDANDVSYIAPLVFIQSTNLKRLDMQWNQLTVDVMESLYLPSSLQEIDLAYNKITALKSIWWQQLNNLRHLYLGANPIAELTSTSFGVMPSLLVIHLGNKELSYIEPSTFDRMFSLSRFSLSASAYKYLPMSLLDECKQTLQSIDLAASPITEVQSYTFNNYHFVNTISLVNMTELTVIRRNAFYNMSSLQSIVIKKCSHLQTIERDAFMYLPLLTTLDLSDNRLKTIHADLISITDLVVIQFTNNYWRCDCRLVRLYEDTHNPLAKQSIDDSMECHDPVQFRGMSLLTVSQEHDACSIQYATTAYNTISDSKHNRTKGEQMAPLHTSSGHVSSINPWICMLIMICFKVGSDFT